MYFQCYRAILLYTVRPGSSTIQTSEESNRSKNSNISFHKFHFNASENDTAESDLIWTFIENTIQPRKSNNSTNYAVQRPNSSSSRQTLQRNRNNCNNTNRQRKTEAEIATSAIAGGATAKKFHLCRRQPGRVNHF